jgi:capsular polysaccharide biosynthesis protein
MEKAPEKSKFIPGRVLTIASSKMFTYPTRLMDFWTPEIMDVNVASYQLNRPEVQLTVRQDCTSSLNIPAKKIVKLSRKLTAPIQMGNEYIYDSRYDIDCNIAHILLDVVAVLLEAQEISPKITVILQEKASSLAKKIYDFLGFPILCTNKNVQGKLISISHDGGSGFHESLFISRFSELTFAGLKHDTPERVFISRKGSRCLINESEIEQILQEYGFEKIYFEDIPLGEQWSITKNAKVVIGLHGAALSSLVFNRKGIKVIELFHPGYVAKYYRGLANAVGGTWCGVIGQLPENIIKELEVKGNLRSFANSSTKIDLTSLRKALDYLEVDKKQ